MNTAILVKKMCKGCNVECGRKSKTTKGVSAVAFDFKKEYKDFYMSKDKPATIEIMHDYMEKQGYVLDISDKRLHHEIYLSDARKVAPEKLKTVIRHPIRKKDT